MFLRTLARRFALVSAALGSCTALAAPLAAVTFSPNPIAQGQPVRLAVTVSDTASGVVSNVNLAANQVVFPAGMVIAANPPVDNQCGGTVVANVGDPTLSISGGLPSPGGSFCAVYVYLTTPSPGSFLVTMPAGAVTTDQGTNAVAWSDTLAVNATPLVTNTNDSGVGSLRDAINTVNANCSAGGPQRIEFNVDVAGAVLIEPLSALPQVTCGNVTIDGYTQPLTSPNLGPVGCVQPVVRIELSGAKCGAGCNGLELGSLNQVVRGLALHSWTGSAIRGVSSGTVSGNIIGADASGNVPAPNINGFGISVANGSLEIGGGSSSDSNLIVGNAVGIEVDTGGNVSVDNNQLGGLGCGSGNGNGVGINFAAGSNGGNVNGNFIRYGSSVGVAVDPTSFRPRVGTNATNSIADNGRLGIDFNNDGPTPNDDESDSIQNYAVVTGITFDGSNTLVSTQLQSAPFRSVSVTLYQNSRAVPGLTEGETALQSLSGSTDSTGQLNLAFTVSGNADNFSTQVQTCGDGCSGSSEFSPTYTQAMFVPPAGPILDISGPFEIYGFPSNGFVDGSYVLSNIGDRDLTISSIALNPALPDLVLNTTACPATLKPTEGCTVVVRFTPTASGSQGTTITVASNAALSPSFYDISAVGLQPLQIAIVTPANPGAGTAVTATLQVTNSNPPGTPTIGGVTGSLTIPAGFTVVAANTASCPTFDPQALSAPLKKGAANKAVLIAGGLYVAPGVTCTLQDVQLTAPTAPGPYTFGVGIDAVVVASPAAWENRNGVAFTVTVAAATLTVNPTSLAFGNQNVGTSSPPQAVVIGNPSGVTVPISNLSIPPGYTVSSSCTTSVPPSGCTMLVVFTPTTAGPANGAIVITAGSVDYSIGVTGNGTVPTPVLSASVTPSGLVFATRSVGTRSPPAPVTVMNNGSSPLSIRDISISGDFAFDSTCPVTTALAVGASCTVNVTFGPLVTGARTGTLTIVADDPASPHAVTLSGNGVILPTPTLALDPGAVDFGTLTLGTTSSVQLVTLTNTGSADASFSTATSAPFALAAPPAGSTACGTTLLIGASCVVGVTFTPVVVGGIPGTLVVNSNASNPRITVSLSGTGISGPPPRALNVPGSIDFAVQAFGTRSLARALTITNTTAQAVTVTDIVLSGDFSADEGCPVVPARGSCSVNVYFTPTARGTRFGQASITVAGDTRPYIVTLGGDGGPNPLPVLVASPSRIGFGNALVGPAGPQKSITLANVGELPVVLGSIVSPGDFLVSNHCPATLPAGSNCTLDVVFYPRLAGLRSQTLQVPSNAGNSPARVDLSGTGCSLPNAARARIGQLVCSQ